MANEVIRCSDCGAVFKGVPAWLATANVKFTCTNCPKRANRAATRFEPAIDARAEIDADADEDIEAVDLEALDDIEIPEEDVEIEE